MTKKRPKTTDALMRYLREEKGISISGSSQKRKLMNIGYYHGYKGYRYIGKASNSIHYDVVFDTRFRTNKIDRQVCNAISNATNVPNLNFETITDYLVLIVYLLSLLRISKNDSKRLISSYIECTERLRKAIPANVYSQIIRTDNSSKVVALRKFI